MAGGKGLGGQSAGGAYPDGARRKDDGTGEGGFMGHGGQSHQAYSGPGDKTDSDRDREEAGQDNAVSED